MNINSILKRMLILLIPTILVPLGAACYYTCTLGADPFSVMIEGEHLLFNIPYGKASMLNLVVIFVFMLLFGKKQIGIGTITTTFTVGPLIDFFRSILIPLFPADTTELFIKLTILAIGCISSGIGIGVYMSLHFGLGPVEFLTLFFTEVTNFPIKYVKITLDFLYVLIGYLLGGTVGLGTIVGVLATGPILSATAKWAEPKINTFCNTKIIEV